MPFVLRGVIGFGWTCAVLQPEVFRLAAGRGVGAVHGAALFATRTATAAPAATPTSTAP
jgi:hypothetical protein